MNINAPATKKGDRVTYEPVAGPPERTAICVGHSVKDKELIVNLDDGHWCYWYDVVKVERKGQP